MSKKLLVKYDSGELSSMCLLCAAIFQLTFNCYCECFGAKLDIGVPHILKLVHCAVNCVTQLLTCCNIF